MYQVWAISIQPAIFSPGEIRELQKELPQLHLLLHGQLQANRNGNDKVITFPTYE